jgi:RimJ/RimL family protein N-acetyltransferase
MQLRPLLPSDSEFLYQLAFLNPLAFRWRFFGTLPRRDSFMASLWPRVLTQFIITAEPGSPAGLVVAFDADFVCRHVSLSQILISDGLSGSNVASEALELFAGYLFNNWDFEKLYLEYPTYSSCPALEISGAREDGRLRDFAYLDGRLWDQVVVGIYRGEFDTSFATEPFE